MQTWHRGQRQPACKAVTAAHEPSERSDRLTRKILPKWPCPVKSSQPLQLTRVLRGVQPPALVQPLSLRASEKGFIGLPAASLVPAQCCNTALPRCSTGQQVVQKLQQQVVQKLQVHLRRVGLWQPQLAQVVAGIFFRNCPTHSRMASMVCPVLSPDLTLASEVHRKSCHAD